MDIITHARRPLTRRLALALLCVLAVLLAAATVNLVGISLMGDTKGWSEWLLEHTTHFAVWRGILYSATALGWWWMRVRVLRRESNRETRARLLRTEISAVLAVTVLEITMLLQSH
jgi:hypothetical protein